MLIKVFGSAVFGVEATTITVGVNIDKGVGYHLVGLPDNAIKESSYRIAAALKNNGYNLVLSVGSATIYTNCNFNLSNGTASTPYATAGANL